MYTSKFQERLKYKLQTFCPVTLHQIGFEVTPYIILQCITVSGMAEQKLQISEFVTLHQFGCKVTPMLV